MADGSTVVKIYYNRNVYSITFDSGEGTEVEAITGKYGSDVTEPAEPTRTGYVFSGWNPSVPSTMPLSGINVVAEWTPASGTEYKVEHWLENANDTGYTKESTDTLSGTTLDETEAEANTYEGFTVQPFSQT